MNDIVSKYDIISVLQSGSLGLIVGAVFSVFGFQPPSPDNIASIIGIVCIYAGWALGSYFLK